MRPARSAVRTISAQYMLPSSERDIGRRLRSRMRYRCVLALSLAAMVVVGFLGETALSADAPAYVGSEACGACHVDQMKAWSDSHHSWALRPATPANILGDFN